MEAKLNILHLEDVVVDADLIQETLTVQGIAAHVSRIETEAELRTCLYNDRVDLVISDYTIPGFNGLAALKIVREVKPNLPFIFVSGTIGEEIAIESLKNGATDYVLKEGLQRLGVSVTRAIKEVGELAERKAAEENLRLTNQQLQNTLAALQAKSEELASMTQQLWQASKLATMGELAASVAHELNNPLATLALHAESLLDHLPVDDPKHRAVRVIAQEVDRMATLVSNLLLFSRRSHPQTSTVDLVGELKNTLEFIHYHLRSHKINIILDFAEELPSVHADRQQLRQLFLNLLTNASDAMPNGGTLTLRARTRKFQSGVPALMVEFSDNGSGIDPADLPKLWEPFFTTKPEGRGTGLGLSICRRTVEEHRGTIEIESQPGKGTTVQIMLPAIDSGASEA